MAISVGEVEATLRLKDEMSLQVAKAMVAFKAAMDQAEGAAKKMGPAVQSVSDQFDKLGTTLQKTGRTMTEAGAGLTKALTVPLTLLGGGAMKAAIDFESSFAGVRKTMKATEKEFDTMSDGIRKLAKTLPIGVNELNRLGMMAGQLGISKEHIVDFVEVAAKLGSVTTMSADDAANGLARLRNIMGTAETDIGKMGAALVALGNAGASSESEIIDMSLRIAAAGTALHMTEGDVMGFANALSSVGIHAEMGGSAMSRLMLRISEAVRNGGEDLEKFATVARTSSDKFAAAFNKDAAQAIIMFAQGMRKSGDEGVNLLATMADLDVKEVRMRQTLLGLAASADKLGDSVSLGNKAFQEGKALNEAFAERMKTTAAQLKILYNNLYDVGIELGRSFKPMMDDAVKLAKALIPYLKDAAEWFGKLPEPIRLTALGLGLFLAAIGPVIYLSGQLVMSMGALYKAFALLKSEEAVAGAVSVLPKLGTALGGVETILAASPFLRMLLFGGFTGAVIGGGIALVANQADKLKADLQRIDNARKSGSTAGGAIAGTTDGAGNPLITQAQIAAQQAKAFNGFVIDGIPALKGLEVAEAAVAKTTFGFGAALQDARERIAKLSPQMRNDLTKAIQSGAFDMEAMKEKTGLSEIALKLFEEQVKGTKKALDEDLKSGLKSAEERMDSFHDAALRAKKGVEDSISYIKTQFKFGTQQVDVSAMLGGATGAAALAGAHQIKATTNLFGVTPNTVTGTTTGRSDIDEYGRARPTGTGGATSEGGLFSNVGANLASSALSALQGGGHIGASVAGSFGQTLGTNLVTKFGKQITEHLGPVLGEAVNTAIPLAGALIGPGIEMLMKIFGDHVGKDIRKMGKQMGVDLSDGLVDAIKADSKKFGGEVQGMLLNLDKVIGEAGGVAAFGIDKAIAKTRDLFVMLETGKLKTKEVGAEFDKVFAQIGPEAIDKFTGLAKPEFLELIRLAQKFGLESKAVVDFLQGQAANVAGGLNSVAKGTLGLWNTAVDTAKKAAQEAGNLKVDMVKLASQVGATQESFDRLGRLAVVAFAAGIGSGKPLLETIKEISPTLDILSGAVDRFGFKSNGAIDELMGIRKFVDKNPEVVDALGGLNSMMSGLQNLGLLTQDTFSDLTATATDTFKKMVAGGLTGDQAMALMQPTLQTIWKLHKDNGLAIDENTQKLLDDAVAAGIVGEKHKTESERMVTAMENVSKVLELIAIALGVTIPAAAGDATKAINDIPDKTVHINVDRSGFPEGGDGFDPNPQRPDYSSLGGIVMPGWIHHLAFGGVVPNYFGVGGGVGWAPHGTDTVAAMLTPGEGVVSRRGMDTLGADGLRDLNNGRSSDSGEGGSAGDFNVLIEVDARGALLDTHGLDQLSSRLQHGFWKAVSANKNGAYSKARAALNLKV